MTRRVAVVSDEAYAAVSGIGSTRLKEATLVLGYQVGYAIAPGPIQLQMQGLAMALGVNPDPSKGDPSRIVVRPNRHGSLEAEATVYPGIELSPGISEALTTGAIADVPLARGPVRDGQALVGIPPTDVEIDDCLGPAAIRSYAVLTTKSGLADDTIAVYGDPATI